MKKIRVPHDYDGPLHTRLVNKLQSIAKQFSLKLYFRHDSDKFSGEYWTGSDTVVVMLDNSYNDVVSIFFHELGHHLDYKLGRFPVFYNLSSPLYKQRAVALKAERSADKTGQQLCKVFFPKVKYVKSYIHKYELDYLKEFYADGRFKNHLTSLPKSNRVK